MWEIDVIRAWCSAALYRTRQRRGDERGASELVAIVVLVAIIAAGAIAVGTILITKAKNKANTIPTE